MSSRIESAIGCAIVVFCIFAFLEWKGNAPFMIILLGGLIGAVIGGIWGFITGGKDK